MTLYRVHRVRFFSYSPEPVCCMAYDNDAASLAVARKGGSLEVYNMADNFFCERTVPGHGKDSIQALCWAAGKRLFAVGLDGILTEFDLRRLRVRTSMDAYAGPLWCLAASHLGSSLAVGCEDGSIRVYELNSEGAQFNKALELLKGRVLCLSWAPSDLQLVSGSIGFIRILDINSGKCIQQMAVGRRDYHAVSSETIVWAVGWLDGGVVAGAESTGRVQLWETTHGTLLHTFDLCSVDIRSLAVVKGGHKFYVGTAEGRVYEFQLMDTSAGVDRQWVSRRRFRCHSHDVCALACCEDFVVSGGLDAQITIRPFNKAQEDVYKTVLRRIFFPHQCLVSCAKDAGMLLFRFPLELQLWRLGTNATGINGDFLPVTVNPEKILELKCKGKAEIVCSAVSSSGEWIAYSTVRHVNVYKIDSSADNPKIEKVRKLPKSVDSALCLAFVPHSAKLVVASPDNHLHIVQPDVPQPKLLHSFGSREGRLLPVRLLSISEDGQWLVSADCGSHIDVYSLTNLQWHCTLPVYQSQPSALAFGPSNNDLVVAYADRQVLEFGVSRKKYTAWSLMHADEMPKRWVERDTPITHITFNCRQENIIILHDMYHFSVIDKTLPLTFKNNLRECSKYKPLLFVDVLGEEWMVVVERSIDEMQTQLPKAILQKKFGM
uniref:LOW QUALITY PROTEIN: U3 small nucleolar RNA-associated protein 4 homolog n=1 Tax=Myxine glutinosa TaxID=7769 RepID=UPI00358FB2C8